MEYQLSWNCSVAEVERKGPDVVRVVRTVAVGYGATAEEARLTMLAQIEALRERAFTEATMLAEQVGEVRALIV